MSTCIPGQSLILHLQAQSLQEVSELCLAGVLFASAVSLYSPRQRLSGEFLVVPLDPWGELLGGLTVISRPHPAVRFS